MKWCITGVRRDTDKVLTVFVNDLSLQYGYGFEPTQRHCVVFFSKRLYPLLSTGSTQEDVPQHN